MIFLTTKSGKVSKINVVALLTFIVGVIEIVKPQIPVEWLPYVITGIAVINFFVRTYFPQGGEVKTSF